MPWEGEVGFILQATHNEARAESQPHSWCWQGWVPTGRHSTHEVPASNCHAPLTKIRDSARATPPRQPHNTCLPQLHSQPPDPERERRPLQALVGADDRQQTSTTGHFLRDARRGAYLPASTAASESG